MNEATTPFGRRPLSLAVVASQAAAKAFVQAAGEAPAVTHKWRLFRAATEAKARLGVGDRTLSVLYALLSFHPETALTPPPREDAARAALTVFPSNRELSLRAHGMAPATLRRHLAALIEAGLILRRDSANGKRFARRGADGDVAEAFGFDLTPLVMRAAEIERLAGEARAEARARALAREKITLLRRDVAKMIETGLTEGVPGDWAGLSQQLAQLVAEPLRLLTAEQTASRGAALATLAEAARKLLESFVSRQNMSANESHNERHIQNQITNAFDSEPRLRCVGAAALETKSATHAPDPEPESGAKLEPDFDSMPAEAETTGRGRAFPLGMVLSACPDISDFAPGGISRWRDLQDAAEVARAALGVSPDAWAQAREVLGADDAAAAVAAILQRGPDISSPGGYLRALTAKARAGEFSLGPLLMALLRGKAGRERRRAG
ncbi:plasmid replication protein RepC [Methylocystis sp. IM3]|uniref:plasmid replication protein RepC n=1 Tax=Methylocystis sp. IM3 TaxID=3136722 RepID=UPI00311A742A